MNKKNEIISTRRALKITVTAVVFAVLVGALATGSVAGDPVTGCDTLNNPGETYEITQDIDNSTVENCIEITEEDIVLDGQGYRVNGSNQSFGSYGITVGANNVTVKNAGNVTGWQTGIQVQSSDDVTLTDNTANNNRDDGINVGSTSDGELTDNTVNNNGDNGIYLQNSSGNDLIGNEANNNDVYGIWVLDESNFNDLFDNIARDNSGGEGDTAGIYLGGFDPVNNNTLVNNTATGDQTWGIYLSEASDNELRENKANRNNEAGIYLTQNSISNELFDNVANRNGMGFEGGLGIYGIWLDGGSNDNNLTGNEAFDNGITPLEGPPENGGELLSEYDEVEANEVGAPIPGSMTAGIYLGGFGETAPVFNNTLIDNDARDISVVDGGNQYYGIWLSGASENRLIDNTANENLLYGIWLSQGSSNNRLIDNIAEDNGVDVSPPTPTPTPSSVSISDGHGDYVEGSSGIYLGGDIVGPEPVSGNTLIDNTARGSEYGIWIKNSFGNDVSESLAEDNYEGIAVEIVPTPTSPLSGDISTEAIAPTGNTFTNDTSRNNDWDFVTETPSLGLTTTDTDIDLSTVPVRNLKIGASTKPGTTISFEANNVSLRSVRNPQSDPSGLSNIGRYFEANRTEGTTNPALSVAVSYEDADVSNVDESTLELRRFNETAGEWQQPPPSFRALDKKDNLIAGGFLNFSNFGVFGEGGKTCINRRNLGRGQEDSECPFDRDIERGGSREELDRDTGRGGGEEHRDSETARRNRGRGEGRSR